MGADELCCTGDESLANIASRRRLDQFEKLAGDLKLHKSAADYAAIAVAPVLIFLMISALANFLVLLLYSGGFPQRVAWTLLMFTMGSVAIARIAIEQSRAYSLGYAVALGAATFVVMSRFVGSPLFCAFILAVIAYLADVIVRDCTIIDDDVDASGEGLIDAGRLFVKKQIEGDLSDAPDKPMKKTHQPGRTVMYLAFGALPLFGLGQFMLRGDSGSWTRAQTFLAIYLFAALALLVTTSFLGLRRYLRQRGAEMPGDVAVSWLGGGIAIIAVVLLIAYVAPLPGKALASIQLPEFLSSLGGTTASEAGWGDEGSDKSNPDATTTSDDATAQGKEIHSETMKEGGEAGDVGDGNRDDGPVGKQSGGKQQPAGSDGESKGKSESSNNKSGDQPDSKQNKQSDQKESETPQSADSDNDDKNPPKDPDEQQQQANGKQQESSSKSQSQSPAEMMSQMASGIGSLIKLLIILALAGVVAWFAWLNWDRFLLWLQSLLNADSPEVTATNQSWVAEPETPPRPFSSYQNPIGKESDLRRVVVITFQAFEAWAREQGASREKDETPSEFSRRAATLVPNLGSPVSDVVKAYNRIVYGRGKATQKDIDAATQVWRLMR